MPRVSRPLAASTLTVVLIVAACGGAQSVPSTPTSPVTPSTAAVTATPTPAPAATTTPVPVTKSPAPTTETVTAPSPTPPPTADETLLVMATPVWALDAPLVLKGTAGTSLWSDVMFAARTVSLQWTGKPADKTGCKLSYQLESKALPKTLKGSGKTTSTKALSGKKDVLIKYGDGAVTVKTDCATWSLKIVPTGHPGVVIKRASDATRSKATDRAGLNEALAKSHVDWWLSTNYTYRGTSRPSVVSKKVTTDLTYELPKWSAPEGTDPQLVTDWKSALAGMKNHEKGEAAIAVQAAGRYLASLTKTKFSSMKAMKKYFDAKGEKFIDWANNRTQAYNESTDWGSTQGGFLQ